MSLFSLFASPTSATLRTLLLGLLMAVTLGGSARAADWPIPLPPDAQPRFRWDQVSGYFFRRDYPDNFFYVTPDGMLNGQKWSNGDISYFIGRWKLVYEMMYYKNPNASVLMASDEVFCDSEKSEMFLFFRDIDVSKDINNKTYIEFDYALDVFPPSDPLSVPNDVLWNIYQPMALQSAYKMEGHWYPIAESEVPQWFRDLVAKLVLTGRYRCDDPPKQ